MIKKRKNFFKVLIGILFCIVCAVCFSILFYSFIYSLSEKTRLEAIGATVNLKFTWLFFVDVLVIIVSGIIGIKLIFSKRKNNLVASKDNILLNEERIYNTSDNIKESYDRINSTSKERDVEVKNNSGLKINNGSRKTECPIKNNDIARHSEDKSSSSSTGNGFFSSGGDL